MLFTTALPAIAALVSVASAAPLEARGNYGDHTYTKSCAWSKTPVTTTCHSKDWWSERNCCKTENKCYWNQWGNKWECCTADKWDWVNNCPQSYYNDHNNGWAADHQRIIYYGGYSDDCRKQYQFDCDNGRNNYYWGKSSYTSYKQFCDKNPTKQWGYHPSNGGGNNYNHGGNGGGNNYNHGGNGGGNNYNHDNGNNYNKDQDKNKDHQNNNYNKDQDKNKDHQNNYNDQNKNQYQQGQKQQGDGDKNKYTGH